MEELVLVNLEALEYILEETERLLKENAELKERCNTAIEIAQKTIDKSTEIFEEMKKQNYKQNQLQQALFAAGDYKYY